MEPALGRVSAALLAILAAILTAIGTASLAACPSPGNKNGGGGPPAAPVAVSLFFTAELRGEIEPCGCTSDPLGDMARIAALVEDAKKTRPVAWFDGGSTLYSEAPLGASRQAQESLRSDLLVAELPKLGLTALGLGPLDLAAGPAAVRLPRQAANVPASAGVPLEAPRVVELGGAKVGVVGVVAPERLPGLGATDAALAAQAGIKAVRSQGAQVVVLLAMMDRKEARRLAKAAPGADIVLAGAEAPDPDGRTPKWIEALEGGGVLIQPYQRGQSLVRLDLTIDPKGGALVDAIGEARAQDRLAELEAEITALGQKLATFEQDPSAEPTFVAQKRAELAAFTDERKALLENPLRRPERGSWFTSQHLLVRRGLRCVPAVVEKKRALDRQVGEANLSAAQSEKPAPVPAGGAGFSGREECSFCHQKQEAFFQRTRHAQAFATLERLGKQLDRYCVSCHVTGWLQPGGSVLTGSEGLRDVQCEVCHGPSSLHVDSDGKRLETLIKVPTEARCKECHSPEHSDTFAYEAYLRDVTGPGHGEAFRKRLGDGPVGHELRAAAKAKAGAGVGEGCGK
jgi:hypothetical protein